MAVDQADVVNVQADAILPAQADAEDVMDVGEHVLENAALHVLKIAVEDVMADAADVMDALDVEAHVQAHAHQAVKDHLVPIAMAVLAVLVRVLHARHALDAVDVMDVVDAVAVHLIVMGALGVLVDVMVAVLVDAQEAVVDALVDAVDAQDAVRDAMAHVLEIATGVVMAVVDNVKTHVLLPAQQRVQVPAKLKRLVP